MSFKYYFEAKKINDNKNKLIILLKEKKIKIGFEKQNIKKKLNLIPFKYI